MIRTYHAVQPIAQTIGQPIARTIRYTIGCMALSILFCTLCASAQTPSIGDVLNRYYQAIGGAEKYKAVTSCVIVGKTISSDGSWKKKFTVTVKGSKLRTDMDIQPGMKMVQAFDGSSGWSIVPWTGSMEPQPMNAENAKSMAVRNDLFRNDLIMYRDEGTDAQLQGTDEIDGSDCYKIIMKRHDGVTKEYYLDVDSYLIVKVVTKYRINDEDEESEMYYSNYREINGMLVPFASESQGGGGFYAESFQFNVTIDDSIFTLPKKG